MTTTPKLADVAQTAGVSVTTASVVLNRGKQYDRISKDCVRRVNEAAEQLGYVPNYQMRTVRTGKTQTVGLVIELVDNPQQLANPSRTSRYYFHQIADGIQTALTPHGYYLMQIWPSPERTAIERGIRATKSKRIDGMIALQLASKAQAQALLEESLDIPIISLEERQPTCIPTILFDEMMGITKLIDHLYEKGHRKMLWVCADTTRPNRFVERERHMLKALASKGCQCEFCPYPEPTRPEDFYEPNLIETARKSVAQRLKKPYDFTAVICYSDIIAIGAHRAILQAGLRIPEDLSLTGYDALFHEYLTPRLTTIDHRIFEMGLQAGNVMMKMLKGGRTAVRDMQNTIAMIKPELVIGDSVSNLA
jgi:LacI family transcriptional regulator